MEKSLWASIAKVLRMLLFWLLYSTWESHETRLLGYQRVLARVVTSPIDELILWVGFWRTPLNDCTDAHLQNPYIMKAWTATMSTAKAYSSFNNARLSSSFATPDRPTPPSQYPDYKSRHRHFLVIQGHEKIRSLRRWKWSSEDYRCGLWRSDVLYSLNVKGRLDQEHTMYGLLEADMERDLFIRLRQLPRFRILEMPEENSIRNDFEVGTLACSFGCICNASVARIRQFCHEFSPVQSHYECMFSGANFYNKRGRSLLCQVSICRHHFGIAVIPWTWEIARTVNPRHCPEVACFPRAEAQLRDCEKLCYAPSFASSTKTEHVVVV